MSNYRRQYNHITVIFQDPPQTNTTKQSPQQQETYCNGRKKDINYVQIEEDEDSEQSDLGIIRFAKDEDEKKVCEKQIVPWISRNTKKIKDPLLRFHNEIIEFYNYLKPSTRTHSSRMRKFNFLKQNFMQMFPGLQVFPFGSFATQLYLPDGDIDIVVVTNGKYNVSDVYNKIHKFVSKKIYADNFKQIEYLRYSKVPLVKFLFQGVQVDISVDKTEGIEQIKYVEKIMEFYPEFKYLVFLMKCTLKIRQMSETYTGGIGSFLLSCMILIYLQNIHEIKCDLTLGEHAIQFMKFYSFRDSEFWGRKILYVKTGKIEDRKYKQTFFSCISPQDGGLDIGQKAFKIRDIFKMLKNRCNYILEKNFEVGESVLRVLVNPSNQIFHYLKEIDDELVDITI